MLSAVEMVDDHDAHVLGGEFEDCTNIMVHAEDRDEAKEIAGLLHEEFGINGEIVDGSGYLIPDDHYACPVSDCDYHHEDPGRTYAHILVEHEVVE